MSAGSALLAVVGFFEDRRLVLGSSRGFDHFSGGLIVLFLRSQMPHAEIVSIQQCLRRLVGLTVA